MFRKFGSVNTSKIGYLCQSTQSASNIGSPFFPNRMNRNETQYSKSDWLSHKKCPKAAFSSFKTLIFIRTAIFRGLFIVIWYIFTLQLSNTNECKVALDHSIKVTSKDTYWHFFVPVLYSWTCQHIIIT